MEEEALKLPARNVERIETKPSACFASAIPKEGRVTEDPTADEYPVHLEGPKPLAVGLNTRVDDDLYRRNYAYAANGRRYISALPRDRMPLRENKGFWFRRT